MPSVKDRRGAEAQALLQPGASATTCCGAGPTPDHKRLSFAFDNNSYLEFPDAASLDSPPGNRLHRIAANRSRLAPARSAWTGLLALVLLAMIGLGAAPLPAGAATSVSTLPPLASGASTASRARDAIAPGRVCSTSVSFPARDTPADPTQPPLP